MSSTAYIKAIVINRAASKTLNHTFESAMEYYQRFSPDLFVSMSQAEIDRIIFDLNSELIVQRLQE